MSRATRSSLILPIALGLLLLPAPARAEVFFTPFAGLTFGGDAHAKKFNGGGSLTFMGGGIAGFEFDVSYSPDFFDEQDAFALIADSNVTTVMGNLVLGIPIGGTRGAGVRPYVAGGVGLIRTRVGFSDLLADLETSDFGLNGGGGLLVFLGDHVGLRADLRYFKRLQDPDDDDGLDVALGSFHFWRATGGIALRF